MGDCAQVSIEVDDVLGCTDEGYADVGGTSRHSTECNEVTLTCSATEDATVNQYVDSMALNSVVGLNREHIELATYVNDVGVRQFVVIANHGEPCPADQVQIDMVDAAEPPTSMEMEDKIVSDCKEVHLGRSQNGGKSGRWDETTVGIMLMLIKNHHSQSSGPTKVELWESVHRGLAEDGYSFSKTQCLQKWRNLVRGHRNQMRNARKEAPGKAITQPPGQDFLKEIGEILALGKAILNADDDELHEGETSELVMATVPIGSVSQRPRGRPRRAPSSVLPSAAAKPEPKRPRRGRPALRRVETLPATRRTSIRNGDDSGGPMDDDEDLISLEPSRSPSPIQVRVVTTGGNVGISCDTHLQMLQAIKEMKESNERNTELLIQTNKDLMTSLSTQLRLQHQEDMEWRSKLLLALRPLLCTHAAEPDERGHSEPDRILMQ